MANKITTKYLLDLVSRSFALAIPLLDKNKKILRHNNPDVAA